LFWRFDFISNFSMMWIMGINTHHFTQFKWWNGFIILRHIVSNESTLSQAQSLLVIHLLWCESFTQFKWRNIFALQLAQILRTSTVSHSNSILPIIVIMKSLVWILTRIFLSLLMMHVLFDHSTPKQSILLRFPDKSDYQLNTLVGFLNGLLQGTVTSCKMNDDGRFNRLDCNSHQRQKESS
jgi:hypothetical protein